MTKTLSLVAFSFLASCMLSLFALVSVVSLGTLVEVSLITLSAWVEDGLVINGEGVVMFCLITVSDVIVLLEFVCAIITFVACCVDIVTLVFVGLTVGTPVVEAVAIEKKKNKELVITLSYWPFLPLPDSFLLIFFVNIIHVFKDHVLRFPGKIGGQIKFSRT